MSAVCRQRLISLSRSLSLFASLVCAATGCALVPGVPAGPLGPAGVRLGTTYAYAYTPASAETLQPSGAPYELRGNSDMYGAPVPLIPLRAMVRANPTSFLDFGADIGWMDAGLQLRAGPLDRRRPLPWGVELEWRTGQHTPFDYGSSRRVRVYRARFEMYPPLGTFGKLDTFGVLTLGASTGARLHFIGSVPEPHDTSHWGGGLLEISRRETRLEASLGAHGWGKPLAITIALQPWLGVHQGAALPGACKGCSLELQHLDASWGLALLASGSLVWETD